MDPATEFRRHADECRRMARGTVGVADRAAWTAMAERWARCADVADSETTAAQTFASARRVRYRQSRIRGRPGKHMSQVSQT
jgi:hypothetical protein